MSLTLTTILLPAGAAVDPTHATTPPAPPLTEAGALIAGFAGAVVVGVAAWWSVRRCPDLSWSRPIRLSAAAALVLGAAGLTAVPWLSRLPPGLWTHLITFAPAILVAWPAVTLALGVHRGGLHRHSHALSTQLKEESSKRRNAEAQLTQTMESVTSAMLIVDPDGLIRMVNAQAETLFGYTRDELIGQPVEMIVPPEHREGHKHQRENYSRQPHVRPLGGGLTFSAIRKDQHTVPVEIGLSPLTTEEGLYVLAMVVDITERRRIDAARDRILSELEHRNRELDEFTYLVSHDLQEPLRQLTAFTRLLSEDLAGELPEKARTDIHYISEAAQRMRTLIQDLLVLSRTAKVDIGKKAVSLDQCADEALSMLSDRIETRKATITRDPLPVLECDARLVTQLYQNLIGNALKFVPSGRAPRIHLTAERIDENWILGVRDNGIGLDPKYSRMIFAPFKRLHNRHAYEGTGVGLALCKKVVERHGGTIWVESFPDAGACFKFTLEPSRRTVP